MFAYRTVFVSDVHLGFRGARAEEFAAFLKRVQCERLYLVGDIVDMWALRQRWTWPLTHNQVIRRLLKLARHGTKVIYIPGNHDDSLRPYAGTELAGIRIAKQAVHRLASGQQLLVCHGDEFDLIVQHSKLLSLLGTYGYDYLVQLNRIANAMRSCVGLGRWSFSQTIKKKVKSACTFISKFEEVLADEAKRRSLDGVICGHIHEPRIEQRADGLIYANCGDWIERASALVEHADGRLEIIDVEALLRSVGWKPDPTEHPETINIPEHSIITEDGAHAY
ncbi:MAG: UDP-2,3-diacylglucosamine diphosphatase [Planctomycetota bacterium]|nr:UDP-2,3-diacylglucosamine diphosphatase [Planctomycetota bacterium]